MYTTDHSTYLAKPITSLIFQINGAFLGFVIAYFLHMFFELPIDNLAHLFYTWADPEMFAKYKAVHQHHKFSQKLKSAKINESATSDLLITSLKTSATNLK